MFHVFLNFLLIEQENIYNKYKGLQIFMYLSFTYLI